MAQRVFRVSEDKEECIWQYIRFTLTQTQRAEEPPIAGGTRKKDGEMTTAVYQRDKGAITTPFKIRQYSTEDLNEETGEWEHHLHTDVYYQGEVIKKHVTDY